jgi:DNA-binding LacI/PurR family transcriptional regulator
LPIEASTLKGTIVVRTKLPEAKSGDTKLVIGRPLLADGSVSKVQAIADWLQLDIRRRALRPGDRYMTSEEAAHALDVSTGTAHHAMRLLVEQNILQRRQKQGTFIGPAVDPPPSSKRPRVHVLTPADAARDSSYARLSETIYPAISSALGGASLQLDFLPAGDSLAFARTLAEEAEADGNLGGFLLMRSTFEIQSFFQGQRLRFPAVVVGNVYPGIELLPRINADHFFIGAEIARYALATGHRRVGVLMYEHWAPGDSLLMSGIAETLERSDQRLDRFEICSLPAYEQSIRHHAMKMLSRDDRPTLIVARMALQVSIVLEVAKELKLRIPQDLQIVFANLGPQLPVGVSIPSFEAGIGMDEFGSKVGAMLSALRSGKMPDEYDVVYPVRLIVPESGGQ